MDYDRTFLIDESPQYWSVTFQSNQALRLLKLFFLEKKWPNTFHYLVRLLENALKRTPN